jgi:hypothetical protein
VSERTIKLSLSEDNGLKLDTTKTKRSTRKAKK